MSPWRWLVALTALLFGRARRRQPEQEEQQADERIVPAGPPERRAENVVLLLLAIAALFAIGFIVTYAEFSPAGIPNELLGICLGMCLLFIGLALTVVAKRLVVTEEIEDEYPQEHPEEQRKIVEIVQESGSRITRKRLLISAGAATGGALGLAALTPALSLGPVWDTGPLDRTPWRAGRRLVDENGNSVPMRVKIASPMTADDHVRAIHIFAERNPRPHVATFHLGPQSGRAACWKCHHSSQGLQQPD